MSTTYSTPTDLTKPGATDVEIVMDEQTHEQIDGRHAFAANDVEVRRNGVLFAVVGGVSTVLALAYLARALTQGGVFGWFAGIVLLGLGVVQLLAFVDARTPLLVADALGIRLRLGKEWVGLRWEDLEQVVVEQRTSVLHDGRLMVVPADPEHVLDDLGAKGRRQAAVAEKMYGAPLVVPLGMTTQVSVRHVVDALAALAGGRTAVVELAGWAPEPVLPMDDEHHDRWEARQREVVTAGGGARIGITGGELVESRFERNTRAFEGLSIFEDLASSVAGTAKRGIESKLVTGLVDGVSHGAGTLVSRMAHGRSHDIDTQPSFGGSSARPPFGGSTGPGGTVLALQGGPTTRMIDVDVHQPVVLGSAAPQLLPDETETSLPERDELLRRPDGLRSDNQGDSGWEDSWDDIGWDVVRDQSPTSSTAAASAEAEPEPESSAPVIGPMIKQARFALDMRIDELSEVTAIRPHVIEAMEVDDFGRCGGDFYARGHLRGIAKELDLDGEALVAEYDRRYAEAPVDARTVLTAEQGTRNGATAGGLRAGILTNRWALVLGVLLCLVLVWGLGHLVGGDPTTGAASGNKATLAAKAAGTAAAAPAAVKVRATRGGSNVEVRDHAGALLWKGHLAAGAQHRVKGVGPFTVKATKPGAVEVFLRGKPLGAVGSGTTAMTRSLS